MISLYITLLPIVISELGVCCYCQQEESNTEEERDHKEHREALDATVAPVILTEKTQIIQLLCALGGLLISLCITLLLTVISELGVCCYCQQEESNTEEERDQ